MSRFKSRSSWKQYIPYVLGAGILFGIYQLYDARAARAFKTGVGSGVSQMVSNVPYFGARYNKKKVRSARKYRKGKRYRKSTARRYKKGRKYRKARRKYRHKSRRGRRRR